MTADRQPFRRIMLKLSGEALGGEDGSGIDADTIGRVCGEIAAIVRNATEVAVVMGAGNFFRGMEGVASGMDRVTSDRMGMIATLMNALALREFLAMEEIGSIVFSATEMKAVAKYYNPRLGRRMLKKGRVALCAGGTGNPFFTTDTAAVLRALELQCDAVLKATKVDGVYDKDPVKHSDAKRFERISYADVVSKKLGVMDLTAVTLAADNNLPIVVFNMNDPGALGRVAGGEIELGTLIG
jgi:uridylate kinase